MRHVLTPTIGYTLCILLEKGFSVITIPLATRYLAPAEYGSLELAVSVVEFVNILFLFGLADTLIRFASAAGDSNERSRCCAELIGAGLLLSVVLGVIVQALVPTLAGLLHVGELTGSLRWALAGAAVAGMLELCLTWMRFNDRIGGYIAYVGLRSVLQLVLIVVVLRAGYGASGLLIANACVMLALTSAMVARQISAHGIALTGNGLRRVASYGLPLVGGAFAMFLLGTSNRWFLAGHVTAADIAFFALAGKLATATTLLIQPFMLWWKPRRLASLGHSLNRETVAREWELGFAILVTSALVITLAAPIFIEVLLTKDYARAAIYVPAMVLVVFLNELNTLCSIGSYASRTGFGVMGINCAGAAVALAGLALLVGEWGIAGAIGAMIAGQLTRLALFVAVTVRSGSMSFPAPKAVGVLAVAGLAVALMPTSPMLVARLGWSIGVLALVSGALLLLGFVRLPALRTGNR